MTTVYSEKTPVWRACAVALSEGLSVSIATASSALLFLARVLDLVAYWTAAPSPAPDMSNTKRKSEFGNPLHFVHTGVGAV